MPKACATSSHDLVEIILNALDKRRESLELDEDSSVIPESVLLSDVDSDLSIRVMREERYMDETEKAFADLIYHEIGLV
jgi:hypothetical protein